jgi:UDP-N-acetylglucosamine 1-carboxyvinyltransferase
LISSVKVTGGTLSGTSVSVSGFKHAVVPIICSSIYFAGKVHLKNVPNIEDIQLLSQIIRFLGGKAEFNQGDLSLDTSGMRYEDIPESLTKSIHGSVYLIPTMLGRFGKVIMGSSGGCQIGDLKNNGKRPIWHLASVLERFGATFEIENDYLKGFCKGFRNCEIDIMEYSDRKDILTGPLVSGATKTAILAAIATKSGTTVIHNPYRKLDVVELIRFLVLSGCEVEDNGKSIFIKKSNNLTNATYFLVSDVVEVITYIACAVYNRFPLVVENVTVSRIREALRPEIEYLTRMGIDLIWGNNFVKIPVPEKIFGVDIEVTSIGMYSDSHPFFTLMLLGGDEISNIKEYVWKGRFDYARQLSEMGARLIIQDRTVKIIPGYPYLSGKTVNATDLRAAAVLILAALRIKGSTIVTNIHHLNRGYDNFLLTLAQLGAQIEPVECGGRDVDQTQ